MGARGTKGTKGSKAPKREYRDPKTPITNYYTLTNTLLGQGSFSSVYLGQDLTTGEKVAIKVIKKSGTNKDRSKNEIEILLRVQHENVISCYGLFDTPQLLYIVMELVTGGELFDRIVERDQYNEMEAKLVSHQLFCALEYLHRSGIVHRDLKPENILLSDEKDVGPIKITDFGLSKVYNDDMMNTACGSPGYIAPEVLSCQSSKEGYTAAVDLWSAGVVLYILLCGYPPFYSDIEGELFEIIMAGDYKFHSPYWDPISAEAKDLISKCLVVDHTKRITAKQAFKHPWFNGIENLSQEARAAAPPLPAEMRTQLDNTLRRSKSNANAGTCAVSKH